MARPSNPLRELAARRLTGTVRAALLASAVVTLAACSDPLAPEPAPESVAEEVRTKMLYDTPNNVIRKMGS